MILSWEFARRQVEQHHIDVVMMLWLPFGPDSLGPSTFHRGL
jgi:hypothetical protein